jgi:hypothetical protein
MVHKPFVHCHFKIEILDILLYKMKTNRIKTLLFGLLLLSLPTDAKTVKYDIKIDYKISLRHSKPTTSL